MVKPYRTLLLLFYIACLTSVIMIFSQGEMKITEDLSLNVFTFKDLGFQNEEKQGADISEIMRLQNRLDSLNKITEQNPKKENKVLPDSTLTERIEPVVDPKYPIEFDDQHFPLDNFFESLKNIPSDKELIRMVHYGDSQIEGDRVSSYLRSRMQARFGGCGVGIVPLLEKQALRATISTFSAPNMSKFAVNDQPLKVRQRCYGILGAFFRFTPLNFDSLQTDENYESWVKFTKTEYEGKNDKFTNIENIKILYKSNQKLSAKISVNDSTFKYNLPKNTVLGVFEENLKTDFKKMTINLESNSGADFYGIALDCEQGIALDNVPLRGSSIMDFTQSNEELLRQQIEKLNVKLIILQFGVNVVPNPQKNYGFYEQMIYKQLKYLKTVAPSVNVLVVGVSDMARKSGTGYASYPNILTIREAQKRAAFRADCAFWDLYSAMGGQNSMVSWVNSKPALANKDYTHFSAKGASLVGEMLYNALMKAYDDYKSRNSSLF
ncbi:MAG: hypothetical protein EAZ97_07830 [Bacteroidetes bacterium]|nr:MAG: hypothetical protein EAZ97_07830 [Bacteroidota bacterium]